MATIKARRGWKGIPHKAEPLPDDLVGRIEKETGVLIPIELHEEMKEAVHIYRATRDTVDGRPSIPEQRAGIEDLQKRAKEFVDCLGNLDDASRSQLVECWDILGKAILYATLVKGSTGRALKKDRFKQHRRGCSDCAMHSIVRDLIPIYEAATGLKAGRGSGTDGGPFVRFCESFIKTIDPSVQLSVTTIRTIISKIHSK